MTVSYAAAVLRLVVAAIFCTQGILKSFGPRGRPHGREATAKLIAGHGWPYAQPLALLLGVSELTFGVLVGAGLLTRLSTLPLEVTLVLAIVVFKRRSGFVGGWDWPLSVLAALVAVAILGAGRFSVDAVLGWSL